MSGVVGVGGEKATWMPQERKVIDRDSLLGSGGRQRLPVDKTSHGEAFSEKNIRPDSPAIDGAVVGVRQHKGIVLAR